LFHFLFAHSTQRAASGERIQHQIIAPACCSNSSSQISPTSGYAPRMRTRTRTAGQK
jgi:hypothetical protein